MTLIQNQEVSKADDYALNRDWLASSRLSLQHFVVKLRTGWLLHPKIKAGITVTGTTPLRIGDVAAGNCIWSLDMLSETPTAEITAFDISTAQFPRSEHCPSNLRFETWDIFTPPPPKYHNYFDVIHFAFAIAIFPNGGQDRVTQHLLQLLKPNGWIQWNDVDPPCVLPIDVSTLEPVPREEWPMQIHIMNAAFGGVWDKMTWFRWLDQVLADAGFTNTELHRPPIKRELLKLEYDNSRFIYYEMMSIAFKRWRVTQEGREKIEKVKQASEEEWNVAERGGKIWAYTPIVAIGRKGGGH